MLPDLPRFPFLLTNSRPTAVHPTLLVPEFLWPEPDDQDTLNRLAAPAAARLLGRSDVRRSAPCSHETRLGQLFGLEHPAWGPLRRLGETPAPADACGHWLCADPVHLRFHHERIVLADAGAFDLSREEAEEMVAALNATFADVGQLHVADARRWYLRLNTPQDHPAPPLSAVAGRRLDGSLDGPALPLNQWLNEVQMVLHGLPCNTRRQQSGLPAVNSLWLWGGGTCPDLAAGPPPQWSSVWTRDPLARGLATAAGLACHELPPDLSSLTECSTAGPRPLVVLDQLLPPVLYENGREWCQRFAELDRDWLTPLVSRAIPFTLHATSLHGTLNIEQRPADRWKFWRQPQTPGQLARRFAENPFPKQP